MGVARAKTILIVEDDIIASSIDIDSLEEFGYTALVARSGQEALGIAETTRTIDLALVDMQLGPGIDGIDTARILQSARRVPVVFVSSNIDKNMLDRLGLVDSYGCVAKGTRGTQLAASIAIAFQRQAAERRAREDGLRKILAAMPEIVAPDPPALLRAR